MISDIDLKKADPKKCVKLVADHLGFHFYQCSRKRVSNDKYCKQHRKMTNKQKAWARQYRKF